MQFTITRTKELIPYRAVGHQTMHRVKLGLEITITLSQKEKRLLEKYHDPDLYQSEFKEVAGLTDTSSIKILEPKISRFDEPRPLSKTKVVAQTEEGYGQVGDMERLVSATMELASRKIAHLEELERWGGTEVVDISE